MLVKHKYGAVGEFIDVVSTVGASDYVQNGEIKKNAVAQSIMVESESDLENLTGYAAGSIAYTAGFGSMWQLDADGEWVEV